MIKKMEEANMFKEYPFLQKGEVDIKKLRISDTIKLERLFSDGRIDFELLAYKYWGGIEGSERGEKYNWDRF
jgi:hypothetical protein